MSYKSVDLQVSLPRTVELAPIQSLQQQRSANEQAMLGQQSLKTAEHEASRSVKTESASNGTISEREPRGRAHAKSNQKKKAIDQAQDDNQTKVHPFKGKHIDYSG
jgi:hypothetical protein